MDVFNFFLTEQLDLRHVQKLTILCTDKNNKPANILKLIDYMADTLPYVSQV